MATTILVCTNFRPFSGQPSCANSGSEELLTYLRMEIERRDVDAKVEASVCMGHCPLGPNVKLVGGEFLHGASRLAIDQLLDELLAR